MANNTDEKIGGEFLVKLQRNNKDIKRDRANGIAEDTELVYKRLVEDTKIEIKKLKRKQESLLDLNPATTHSLTFEEFDPDSWVQADVDISIEIERATLKLKVVQNRYKALFGG